MMQCQSMTQPPSPDMPGPRPKRDRSDRLANCEFDIEPAFIHLMDVAHTAGWTLAEVAIAIATLAETYLLGPAAKEEIGCDFKAMVEDVKQVGRPGPIAF